VAPALAPGLGQIGRLAVGCGKVLRDGERFAADELEERRHVVCPALSTRGRCAVEAEAIQACLVYAH
jgi:hypothetical protein